MGYVGLNERAIGFKEINIGLWAGFSWLSFGYRGRLL
jgi:hypothetical protein